MHDEQRAHSSIRISVGRANDTEQIDEAAERLGCSKAAFIEHMGQHDVPSFTETAEELAAQLDALRGLDDDGVES